MGPSVTRQRRSRTFERTYAFAERVARGLEARHQGLVTTEWLKRKREGVLVDHRQNGWGKTIASVYSVRPKPGAPVSTPLSWEELTEDLTPPASGCARRSSGSNSTATCSGPCSRAARHSDAP